MNQKVGIIGAGVSGLAAAYALSKAGIASRIFEKSRGLSGRAATRRREGLCFDHGANFFRLDDPEVSSIIRGELPTDELASIDKPVWTFDEESRIREGDAEQNAEPAWTYKNGISTLGKLLDAASEHSSVERGCPIGGVARSAGGWHLTGEGGEERGIFSKLLVTAPAPQASELLRKSRVEIAEVLDGVSYAAQFTFVLGFSKRIVREKPFHALLNLDRRHSIAWVGFEDDKPGHVPPDQSVLIVQMAPAWTEARMDVPREELLGEVLDALRPMIPVGAPDWWDSQRWRYALPLSRLDASALQHLEKDGLYFAGDGLAGKGRVALAMKSGLQAGKRMIA